jgi:hypothetical protein
MLDEDTQRRPAKRLKSGSACASCRKKKHRCDGERPRCSGCRIRDIQCIYPVTDVNAYAVQELEALVESRKRRSSKLLDPEPAGSILGVATTERTSYHKQGVRSDIQNAQADLTAAIPVSAHPAPKDVPNTTSDGYLSDSSTFAFVSRIQLQAIDKE